MVRMAEAVRAVRAVRKGPAGAWLGGYSMALAGLSGSSYRPTRTLVSWSMTPDFSRYLRNSSFFDSVLLGED